MPAPSSTPSGPPASNEGPLSPEQIQAIARALAEPRRFSIFEQIARQACPDGMMCGHLDIQSALSPATISHHLRELQEAGLIEAQREGRQMRLVLRRPVWQAYLAHLSRIAS